MNNPTADLSKHLVTAFVPAKWYEETEDALREMYLSWLRACALMDRHPNDTVAITSEGPEYEPLHARLTSNPYRLLFKWDDPDDITYEVYEILDTKERWVNTYNTEGEGGTVNVLFCAPAHYTQWVQPLEVCPTCQHLRFNV